MNQYWRPWREFKTPMNELKKHETNCIGPLIKVCLIWRQLAKLLDEWESISGVVIEREIIHDLKTEGIAAAEQVTKEANLAQKVQIENQVI